MNTFTKTSSVLLSIISIGVPQVCAAFSDVSQTHANADAIAYVQSKGIVQGYADGTFRADATINRAEFTKIIIGAVADVGTGGECFPDVHNEWFAPYVCTAKDLGLIGGYPDGTFRPSQNVSFVEAAKIIANAFKQDGGAATSVWYETYVRAMANTNAIPSSVRNFDQKITRGEMAEMIYRLDSHNMTKQSKTYEQLAGIAAPASSSSTATVKKGYPYSFDVTEDWKDAWNFYVDTSAPEVDPKHGVNHLAVLDLERVSRMVEAGGSPSAFLRILFPKGAGSFFIAHFYDKERAGVVATAPGSMEPTDEVRMTYYVRFPEDFDFSTSGSLPGFDVGITTSQYGALGGATNEVGMGWSEKGEIVVRGTFTDDMHIPRTVSETFSKDNKWHRIDISARLNTVPVRRMNGMLVVEYDGERIYQSGTIQFRSRAEDKIDSLDLISTIGGLDTFKVAPKDMYVDVGGFTFDKQLTNYISDAY